MSEQTISSQLENMPRACEKRLILDRMFKCVRSWKRGGDYLEFGTYRGNTFIQAYELAQKHLLKEMKFYAFDSFQGLPNPLGGEGANDRFFTGQYACTLEGFKKNLALGGVDEARVEIVPGFFNESLTPDLKTRLNLKQAAIIWIDCDLYESTRSVLHFIGDYLANGTFLAFDDWFSFGGDPDLGEIRAVNEWLDSDPTLHLTEYDRFHTVGKAFLFNRGKRS